MCHASDPPCREFRVREQPRIVSTHRRAVFQLAIHVSHRLWRGRSPHRHASGECCQHAQGVRANLVARRNFARSALKHPIDAGRFDFLSYMSHVGGNDAKPAILLNIGR